jgi:pyruvate/oxaloacetate carboxyltransferase
MTAGVTDQARQVLEAARAAATKIGYTDLVQRISQLLENQPHEPEKHDHPD